MTARTPTKFNGPALLISMLREVQPAFREQLLAKISSFSPEIARLAVKYEVLYMDVLRVTQASLPPLIAKIPEATLLLAWRLTRTDLRKKWLSGMSERRREDFLVQVANAKPAPRSQIFKAQDRIATILKDQVQSGHVRLEAKQLQIRRLIHDTALKKKRSA